MRVSQQLVPNHEAWKKSEPLSKNIWFQAITLPRKKSF